MRKYFIAAAIAIPVIALLFIAGAYLRDEVIDENRVSRGVTVVGVDVSRSTPSETASIVVAHESDLLATPVVITVDGVEREIDPSEVGLAVDEDAIAQDAMTVRREDGFWANLSAWARSWRSSESIEVPIFIDDAALTSILEGFTQDINKPPYDGTIKIVNAEVVPTYPHDGVRVDVDATVPLVREQLLRIDHKEVVAALAPIPPRIDSHEMDRAVAEANGLVDSAAILRDDESSGTIVFTSAGLKSALRHEIVTNSDARIEVTLDPAELTKIAARSAGRFTIPAVSASYEYDKETGIFTVIPSELSKVVDLDSIPATVNAAITNGGAGVVPLIDGPDAEFDTEAARAGMPMREVSSFTTYHPAGQRRVINIQTLADEIDGSVVLPGETFSINDTAGKRTLAEGYVRAGAIINGEVTCCDHPANVGGGTSQFATTFYNAIFFGCYEDVFHQPHSLYFSRYPYVREATMGFPAPDVQFRNDSDAAVYIDTSYTSGSITVTFYGDNGGRTCTSERSGNTITRVMEHPDGTTTTQQWSWNYKTPKKSE